MAMRTKDKARRRSVEGSHLVSLRVDLAMGVLKSKKRTAVSRLAYITHERSIDLLTSHPSLRSATSFDERDPPLSCRLRRCAPIGGCSVWALALSIKVMKPSA